MYNVASASPEESIVFGSARPGYHEAEVTLRGWLKFHHLALHLVQVNY